MRLLLFFFTFIGDKMKKLFLSFFLVMFFSSNVFAVACRTFPVESEPGTELWIFDKSINLYCMYQVQSGFWTSVDCSGYNTTGTICSNSASSIWVCFPYDYYNHHAAQRQWDQQFDDSITGQTGLLPNQTDTDGDGIMDDVDENPNENYLEKFPVGGDYDGDGILNENDFTPEDANYNPRWRDRVSYRNNVTGEITGGNIELEDGTVIEWGKELDENIETPYVSIAGIWQDAVNFDRGGSVDDSHIFDSEEVETVNYTGMQVDDVGENQTEISNNDGSTDTEILSDIRENVTSTATGVSDVSDKLTRLTENQTGIAANTQRLLDDVKDAIENKVVSGGATSADISSDISSSIEDDVQDALISVPSNVSGENESDYVNLCESDIPDVNVEKNQYESDLENFQNNAFSGVDVGIEITDMTGVLHCEVWGKTINADFTKYEDFFDNLGVLILSLSYLTGFFMIIKK